MLTGRSASPPADPCPPPSHLVFTDVDETLIRPKGLLDFLRFVLVGRLGEEGENAYRCVERRLREEAAEGIPREVSNRNFYRRYAGEEVRKIERLGREWFRFRSADPEFFVRPTLQALRAHREAGAEIILVSGSFPPCLTPIAEAVGARHVVCTTPAVRDGRYTGEVGGAMIGQGKRAAVLRLLAEHPAVDPRDCFAYGDHPSDLPMLECVGHPRVVGDHPGLRDHLARRRG